MGQFFHKKSGSQQDNQALILGCPHLWPRTRGRLNFATLDLIIIIFSMTLSVIEKDGQENRINWSWRTYFHPLATDIAKGLDARMREITERALLAMKKSLDTTGTLEMMPVSQNLVGGRLDYPKWVAKVCTCMPVHTVYCKRRNFRAVHIFAHFAQGYRCSKI